VRAVGVHGGDGRSSSDFPDHEMRFQDSLPINAKEQYAITCGQEQDVQIQVKNIVKNREEAAIFKLPKDTENYPSEVPL
jgi:hypothetical protein